MRNCRAIRCFQLAGEGGWQLRHKNLLTYNLGFGEPTQRPDGLWESNYDYNVDQPSNSACLAAAGEEVEHRKAPHELSRMTVVTSDAYLMCRAALPPQASGDPAPVEAGSGQPQPRNVWNYEVFFHDGSSRWSLGGVYDGLTGQLGNHFLIREYVQELDPATDVDTAALPLPDPRPRLSEAEAVELASGKQGQVQEGQYDSDGKLRRTQEASERTLPPLSSVENGHMTLCYPDGAFAHIPARLPTAGSGSGDVLFTWGCRMREGLEVQQITAAFSLETGRLHKVTSFAVPAAA